MFSLMNFSKIMNIILKILFEVDEFRKKFKISKI